jgi:hypothetical protein
MVRNRLRFVGGLQVRTSRAFHGLDHHTLVAASLFGSEQTFGAPGPFQAAVIDELSSVTRKDQSNHLPGSNPVFPAWNQ